MGNPEAPRYGSDVIVDLLAGIEIPFVALNPGASFRGLHDSLVNRDGAPPIILCPHEKLAVQIAHGYAKASGRMMAAILHDTVGLLHGSLGIFSAYLDRTPVLVLGGAGPMDTARRRPWIDWIHTSNIQGNAVRDFTKWDDQPASIEAMPEAFARARRVAESEPAGPVYLGLDADLQERTAANPIAIPAWERVRPASRIGADPEVLAAAARSLVDARRPLIFAAYAGRDPRAFSWIPRLAELVGAAVIDTGDRLNIPTTHRLNLSGTDSVPDADVILLLDVKDSPGLLETDKATRETRSRIQPGATVIDIGFNELQTSAWVHHHGALTESDIAVTADTSVVLPELIDRIGGLVIRDSQQRSAEREARRVALADRHTKVRERWALEARTRSAERPVSPPRLAAEVWEAICEHDWVLTAGTADGWANRLWDFDQPHRYPGKSLGTATQIGLSLGVALAHRGSGRLVVDLQPDGDLMFDAGALWVASAHKIPMLVVMYNNRAYYNDWDHQIRLAKQRGSDLARAHIGVALEAPAPDFAGLARSFGWHAEGPIDDPDAVGAAVRRAARIVLDEGRPALVDVVCQHR
jgi:thiamine pyrophosphate-dependent acetolactate synthase large subunit-like protein